eukprot:TRINITY_DN16686_c0_g1_i1.p1 TRINITY_DN16686_c0_g1~~TRINITY_DN16686_c0_g1_i1.p1  ORF type:complete len:156 (+),score=0.66 TRINITY_DN16686_c0_g1_i1:84-551(+)
MSSQSLSLSEERRHRSLDTESSLAGTATEGFLDEMEQILGLPATAGAGAETLHDYRTRCTQVVRCWPGGVPPDEDSVFAIWCSFATELQQASPVKVVLRKDSKVPDAHLIFIEWPRPEILDVLFTAYYIDLPAFWGWEILPGHALQPIRVHKHVR